MGSEEFIIEEIKELRNRLEKKNGQPMNTRYEFNVSIVNALWRISTGERLEHAHFKANHVIRSLDQSIRDSESPIFFFMGFMKPLAFVADKMGLWSTGNAHRALRSLCKEAVVDCKKRFQEDHLITLGDHYINHMKEKSNDQQSTFFGETGNVNFRNVLVDLFIGGSETTSTTLNWAILFMILNPEIQKKVQLELDEAFGQGVIPNFAQRDKTPYTEAVIHEIQRKGNILSLSVFHKATEDTNLASYFIPKGTVIFPNLGAVLNDPEYFPNPEKFDPERFFHEGKFRPHPKMLAFGLGRRRCLGESLARLELYLFFTGILSKFNLKKESENIILSDKAVGGSVSSPAPFNVCFEPRF